MFCKKCGNELTDTAEFCEKCGAKVNEEVKLKDNTSIMLVSLVLIVLGLISQFIPMVKFGGVIDMLYEWAGVENKSFAVITGFSYVINILEETGSSETTTFIAIYAIDLILLVLGVICTALAVVNMVKKSDEKSHMSF